MIDVHGAPQLAMTRVWPAGTTIIGLPVGTQVEDAVGPMATGWPSEKTRVAPLVNWPVAHGGAVPVNPQPAMAYGLAIVTSGWASTTTRVLGIVGVALPAWEQKTCEAIVRTNPGIADLTSR
jgi:hypothetical protein